VDPLEPAGDLVPTGGIGTPLQVLTRSETELTTAATDVLLGMVCLLLALHVGSSPTGAEWKRGIWTSMLALLSLASLLGAVAHGLQMTETLRKAIWKPLYLALGFSIALLFVGATCDGWGADTARHVLPSAIAGGVLFFAVTELFGGPFLVFIAYEGLVALYALAIYAGLWARGDLSGAATIALGIGLSLVAAAVQASRMSMRMIVRFDHNGLFHLLQIVSIAVLAHGVCASLLAR